MTEQEKTFITREFERLGNNLEIGQPYYIIGYKSALFDVLEIINNLPTHNFAGNCGKCGKPHKYLGSKICDECLLEGIM